MAGKVKKTNGVHLSTNSVHQSSKRRTPKTPKKKSTNDAGDKGGENPPSSSAESAPPETNTKGRGAPIGNKNAAGNPGGGAPEGNKNALIHGGYETIEFSHITCEVELALLKEPIDPMAESERIILNRRISRHRMNKRLALAEASASGMVVDGVVKTKGIERGDRTDATQTTLDSAVNLALKIEAAMVRGDATAGRVLGQLHKMKMDTVNEAKHNDDAVDDWIRGVMDE